MRSLVLRSVIAVCLLWVPDLHAQLSLVGVAIPGVGSFIDASRFPTLRVRFRATRSGQPVSLRVSNVYIAERNRYIRLSTLTEEQPGLYTAEFATSVFSPLPNNAPTLVSGRVTIHASESGDVGSLPVSWSNLAAPAGANVAVVDSTSRRVPQYIDFGDVAVGSEVLTKLSLRPYEATRTATGAERLVRIDTIMTRTNNFRVVWKGTYGSKAPPTAIESGGSYRFDVIFAPTAPGPISDVLTVVYEGGVRFDIMLVANTPSYAVTPVLRVSYPNGGEQFAPCQEIDIRWKGSIPGFHSHVEYSTDDGRSWKYIDSTLDSTLTWVVPQEYTTNGRIRVYQKQGASGSRWFRGESSPATNLAFSQDGRYLVVAYESGAITEWDVVTGAAVATYIAEGVVRPVTRITALTYVGTSRQIVALVDRASPARDQLQVFRPGTRTPTGRVDVDLPNTVQIGTDPAGTTILAVGQTSGRVRVYDAGTLAERAPIVLSAPSATGSFANGRLTLSLIDGDVVQYNCATLAETMRYSTKSLDASAPAANRIGIGVSGRLVAIAGVHDTTGGNVPLDQRTLVYDTQADALIRVIYREGLACVGATFNASETYLTLGFQTQTQINQYDIVNRKVLGFIPGMPSHIGFMTDIEYAPDGSTLASCSEDLRDNVLVRRIISPESDDSDGIFTIIAPDLRTPTVVIGTRYIGTSVDTTITATVCNNGVVPAVFTAASLRRGTWLTLDDTVTADTVRPGECLSLRFNVNPRDTGLLVDTLVLQECGGAIRVGFEIRSLDRSFTLYGNMTDMGNVCIGDTARRTMALARNNDPIVVSIDGVMMAKGTNSQFRVTARPPTTLNTGDSLLVDLRFIPTRLGSDTDEVVISYAGQVSVTKTIRVIGYGAGADVALSHIQLAFIPEVAERTVTARNRSSNDVVLTSATLPPTAPFTLLTTLPLTIRANDSAELRIRHDGGAITGADVMDLTFAPCASALGIRLMSYIGTAVVEAPQVEADPRGDAEIPISVRITENVAYNGDRPFEGILTVNPRLFLARSVTCPTGTGEIVSQDIVNGERQIRFRLAVNVPRSGVIAILRGPAGLAETDSSPLGFVQTNVPAFGAAVQTTYTAGRLRILNPDPTRFVLHPASTLAITGAAPQPAADDVTLSLQSTRTISAMLTITDRHGVVLRTESIEIMEGASQIHVDTRTLPSGVHMVRIVTPDVMATTTMVVVR